MIYATRLREASGSAWSAAVKGVSWWALPALALVLVALWLTPAVLLG